MTPFSDIPGHVITAERTQAELQALHRHRSAPAEIRAQINRFPACEQAPGHRNACNICQAVARRLLPLKDRWQLFSTECGVSGGFIPCNVSHRMFGLAFGNFLIFPTARPWQAGLVFECAESLLPLNFAFILDELAPPEFAI